MGQTIFRVLSRDDQWRLEHDGHSASYATRTAAFEAAVRAAERAIQTVEEVQIYIDPAPNASRGGNRKAG